MRNCPYHSAAALTAEITPGGKLVDTLKSDDKGLPFLCPNDLTADQKGDVYVTASGSGSTLGKVYYRGADRRVREVASNIRYANGLAVSIDGKRLYLAQSAANSLLTYTIDADAGLRGPKEFVNFADVPVGSRQQDVTPDGVRNDRYGNVLVALYRGGGIAVFSARGNLIRVLPCRERITATWRCHPTEDRSSSPRSMTRQPEDHGVNSSGLPI